ncbi:CD151 antigen-like [Schistocerca gregaria]|uniref:CD151 antigen-like n=1 Tax=Schistocerca gregaria TaxID=7010 RepID=UPI00211EF78F|nr:CD151 antigen-like [Schistocerca gregaria]
MAWRSDEVSWNRLQGGSGSAARGPAPRKSRDSDCCSINFLKYVLHIFNVVFLLAGAAVLAVGVWTLVDKQTYISLLSSATYVVAAWVLLVAGAVTLAVAFLGCCGVWRENRCLLLIYTYLLLLIFLLEAMVGVLAYVYESRVHDELSANLNSTFIQSYNVDTDKTAAIDQMQQQFKCCGAVRFEDWQYSTWLKNNPDTPSKVPDSCCKTPSALCGKRDHPSNIYYNGCIYRLAEEIQAHLLILGAVGLGICVIQIFGMILSCWLYIKLKDVDNMD